MTGLAKWFQSIAANWAALTMTSITSLANTNASFASTIIDNTANFFTDMWLSVSLATTATAAGAPVIGVYLLPLNQDGTTYGDATSGTTVPSQGYFRGNITFQPSLSSGTLVGLLYLGGIDANKYKVVVVNMLGNAFGSGTITVEYALDCLNNNG